MAQISWRAPDELVDRVRATAAAEHRSVNEFLTRLAEAATDPDLAGDEWERTRERLRRAGLLVEPGPPRESVPVHPEKIDPEELAAARAEFGPGRPLSEFVSDGRGPR